MASGKSVVGERLAQILNCRFVDTDQWIEARFCMTIPEIFSEKGEISFRAKEKECLEFLMDKENLVIATGGGLPCHNDAMELMNEMGETVYLKASVETLTPRLWKEKGNRPKVSSLKNDDQLMKFISSHLLERKPLYEKSKFTIPVDKKNIEVIAQEIKRVLK